MVKWKLLIKGRWFMPVVLIGVIVVGLIIISVYFPIKEEQKLIAGEGWARTLGGPDIHLVSFLYSSVQQTSDGGYVAVGEQITDIIRNSNGELLDYIPRVYIVKVDASGNQWNKTFGKGTGESVTQTSDGGYIITVDCGKNCFAVIKTDTEGNMLWNRTHEVCNWSEHDSFDRTYSIQQTADGGYIIAGKTFRCDFFGSDDGFLFKVDSDGNKIWEKIYGESRNSSRYDSATPTKTDWLFSVYQTSDGGYIAFGTTNSFSVKTLRFPEYSNVSYYPLEFWVIKTDANGNMILNKTFGEYYYEGGYLVKQTSDKGYVVSINSHVFKFDENGNKLWNQTIDLWKWPRLTKEEAKSGKKQGAEAEFQELLDANYQSPPHQTSDGGFVIVAAKGTEDHKKIVFYLVKFDENGNKVWYKNVFVGDVLMQSVSVQQTSDGGYIISGVTESTRYSDFPYGYLIKTDENGDV